jgi:hypothetical protein
MCFPRKLREEVDYPLGIIAGSVPSDPLALLMMAVPNDGRTTVEDTQLKGMRDHVVLPTSHESIPFDPASIFQTLQTYLSGLYVNDFVRFGRVYKVFLQAEPAFTSKPSDIGQFYVRNNEGGMVPLSTLVTITKMSGPNFVSRFNLYNAAEMMGATAPGRDRRDSNRLPRGCFASARLATAVSGSRARRVWTIRSVAATIAASRSGVPLMRPALPGTCEPCDPAWCAPHPNR